MTKVVFVGAGHAALIALDRLSKTMPSGTLTLVSDNPFATYSGMIPGWIEGIYPAGAMNIALGPFCAARGIRLLTESVIAAGERTLRTDRGEITFDLLVISIGARAGLPDVKGVERIISAKPSSGLIAHLSRADPKRHVVILGAGAAGIETAFAFRRRPDRPNVTVVEQRADLLPAFPQRFRRRVARRLREAGVKVCVNSTISELGETTITLGDGREIPSDAVLAFTGAAPPRVLDAFAFSRAPDGFLAVHDNFVSVSHPQVIAVGDVATRVSDPRPKAGVFAVRTGKPLAEAVELMAAGRTPPAVRLQKRALVLLATGGRRAIGVRNGLVAEGRWVWRWKDALDRAFVEQFAAGG